MINIIGCGTKTKLETSPSPLRKKYPLREEGPRILHRLENKKWVSQCSSLATFDHVDIGTESKFLCKLSYGYGTDTVRYRIDRESNGTLALNIRLGVVYDQVAPASEEMFEEMLTEAQACIPKLQEFFDRYGIKFR